MNNLVFLFITSGLGALWFPPLAPGAALYAGGAVGGGAIGGGAIGGVGGLLHGKKVNKDECKKLREEGRKLKSRLNTLKIALAGKQPLIDVVEKKINVK